MLECPALAKNRWLSVKGTALYKFFLKRLPIHNYRQLWDFLRFYADVGHPVFGFGSRCSYILARDRSRLDTIRYLGN